MSKIGAFPVGLRGKVNDARIRGAHANSSTQLSNFGSKSLIVFVARSYSTNRNLSLSYPARAWLRHARYLPSGE